MGFVAWHDVIAVEDSSMVKILRGAGGTLLFIFVLFFLYSVAFPGNESIIFISIPSPRNVEALLKHFVQPSSTSEQRCRKQEWS